MLVFLNLIKLNPIRPLFPLSLRQEINIYIYLSNQFPQIYYPSNIPLIPLAVVNLRIMPKKTLNYPKNHKRQYTNIQNDSQSLILNKPRKVVKKKSEVSLTKLLNQKQQHQNFYESIQQIPSYHLSKQQMNQDPIELLNRLEEKYSHFGAIKIVINDSWNAPFTFRYIDKEITTRIQCLQKLKQGKAFEQKVRAYRIEVYQAMAHAFSRQYMFKTKPKGKSEQSMRQQQYWSLITNSQYERKPITIEYAADLSSSIYGSGFPIRKLAKSTESDFEYEKNYFNLNNISKSPSSLLSICQKRKQEISGISYPWMYLGMMFSTFCWHVEDLFLNSLNYNHKGATKTWYVVPGSFKEKFDQYVEKKFQGNSKKKSILQKIVLMIDPKQLINQGIKVYKANQKPREYVCTFYKAYHAGFSHGFNVGEAVNFVSARSLKYIEQGQKYYNQLQRLKDYKPKPLVLSRQWLIYQNVAQGKIKQLSLQDQFIVKLQYEKMIKREYFYIKEELIKKKKIQSIRLKEKVHIIPQDAKYEKITCSHCKNYIYLSAIECKKCSILCQYHIDRCNCGDNQEFHIWIRQPNKDRIKNFQEYSLIRDVIRDFCLKKKRKCAQQMKNKIKSTPKANQQKFSRKQPYKSLQKPKIRNRNL